MALTEDHDDVTVTFIGLPNELKLMFAEELGIHDVNTLARTCREMNELLTRFVFRRAKDSRTKMFRSYFLLAVDDGNLAAVERFIEVGASVNMTGTGTNHADTAIRSCAHYGHVEIAELLIDKGINVSAVDRAGSGVLHSLAMGMNPDEAMVTLLVEAGAADDEGRTPLHDAVEYDTTKSVKVLLEMGADISSADLTGSTPLLMTLRAHGNEASVHHMLHLAASMVNRFR